MFCRTTEALSPLSLPHGSVHHHALLGGEGLCLTTTPHLCPSKPLSQPTSLHLLPQTVCCSPQPRPILPEQVVHVPHEPVLVPDQKPCCCPYPWAWDVAETPTPASWVVGNLLKGWSWVCSDLDPHTQFRGLCEVLGRRHSLSACVLPSLQGGRAWGSLLWGNRQPYGA